ncbi:hypothetical protein CFOL_v3_00393 [Cephalotus follicularis]|uniref:Putative plant transposon protein domain-containing protein n=1 Tax=Cephalotus follicularis TaxID=3775 RepID=A0A1Q3AMR8_CEPFO|nr:hypothetical protein CFOL_v3_00393 [Cephalotus follicularis]
MKEFHFKFLPSSRVYLNTTVKHTEIGFSCSTLATILDIPNEGARGWNQRNWIINNEFNKEECVRMLFGENADCMQRMYTRNLSLHHRFLHRAIATHILPKAGGFDEVTHIDAYTMYHLITSKRINVPNLIIHHMLATQGRENGRLAYSNIITKIFIHFGVDLSGELHHSLQSADKLGNRTLGRMGFKKYKRLVTWIPREENSNRVIEDEGEEMGEEAQGEAANEPQVDPTPNVNLPRTQFEELMEAIKGIKVDVQTLKRRQKRIARRISRKETVSDKNLITSSSEENEAPQREDGGATDELGDMDGDNEDDNMDV